MHVHCSQTFSLAVAIITYSILVCVENREHVDSLVFRDVEGCGQFEVSLAVHVRQLPAVSGMNLS